MIALGNLAQILYVKVEGVCSTKTIVIQEGNMELRENAVFFL